jgi:hypothetical protein
MKGNIQDIIDGLKLLSNKADGGWLAANHDIIYFSAPKPNSDDIDLTDEERDYLVARNWFWNGEFDCWSRFV